MLIGHKNPKLFTAIDDANWIPDELHTMLRISDILMQCFFYELMRKKKNLQILHIY